MITRYDLSIFYRDSQGIAWRKDFFNISRAAVNQYNTHYREKYEVLHSMALVMNYRKN